MTHHLEGKRIRLLHMPNDPCPVPSGSTGTIQSVGDDVFRDGTRQIHVKWDNGRSLMLIDGVDQFEVIPEDKA